MTQNVKELLSFNVSARTARLIGRENVATSDGAIIELVKNTYDADADFCIIKFDIPYVTAPATITKDESIYFESLFGRLWGNIKGFYLPDFSGNYVLDIKQYNETSKLINVFFRSLSNIYIIDNGEGMDVDIIKKHWMTIGTDNKNDDYVTEAKKRTKSGAKGIGRFALDRLGENCEMWTKKQFSEKVIWQVDWETFDQSDKKISDINASIEIVRSEPIQLKDYLSLEEINTCRSHLQGRKNSLKLDSELQNGTVIKISVLRDYWDVKALKKLKDGLEKLVPPVEDDSFQLFFFNNIDEHICGLLKPEYCDSYDYKLDAIIKSGMVSLWIHRNEIDVEKVPPEFYDSNPEYESFKSKNNVFDDTFKLSELIPGSSDNKELTLIDVGDFTFSLYFMKKNHSSVDGDKYYYNNVNYKDRNEWLENNSGIKIFRDHFRVRPYGDENSSSWDWLGLGNRFAQDPSQVSRKGKWKVSPQNISGIINISRVNNPLLADKSNREGLHENQAFSYFKLLVIALIKKFEDDRSSLFSQFDKFYKSRQFVPNYVDISSSEQKRAENLATMTFHTYKEKAVEGVKNINKSDTELLSLSLLKEKADKDDLARELIEMREENSLLRVFASSGVTIASFAHELENLESKLGGNRYNFIKKVLEYNNIPSSGKKDFSDPYYRISLIEKEDLKLKNWLNYSLRTIRKDKRNRKNINLYEYFEELHSSWAIALENRQIFIQVKSNDKEFRFKAFEIDLDCVFNNLIINSCDAFRRQGTRERLISINIDVQDENVNIVYCDKGPGLSVDIKDPYDIFKPTFTTKLDQDGKEIGTGLGLWLVSKTLEEYNAKIIISPEFEGFKLEFIIPRTYS